MVSVDSIRLSVELLISQGDQYSDDDAKRILKAYVDTRRSLANRLTRCVFYLRKGFRSEAFRLMNLEPGLMVSLAKLEFTGPGRKAIAERCASYHLSIPDFPDLSDELLRCEAETGTRTRVLMDTLRRYCLAKQSVERRVEVLTELSKLEPHDPVWQFNLSELSR